MLRMLLNMIFSDKTIKEYYKVLVENSSEYEGIFFYALNSTGTFCRPTCPSRKPKIEIVSFLKRFNVSTAYFQIERIAKSRGVESRDIKNLVDNMIIKPGLEFLGEACVNVLMLNKALDKLPQNLKQIKGIKEKNENT
jgi:hypothetical protein